VTSAHEICSSYGWCGGGLRNIFTADFKRLAAFD